MERTLKLEIILALSLIGLAVAGYQTYEHYYITSSICDVSAQFSCSVVTESQYGDFPPSSGVATAAWGMLWWIGAIALVWDQLKGRAKYDNEEFYLFGFMASGVGFVLYLLLVELYILPQQTGELVICPLCTVQHVLILFLAGVSYTLLRKPLRDYLEETFYLEVEEDHEEVEHHHEEA